MKKILYAITFIVTVLLLLSFVKRAGDFSVTQVTVKTKEIKNITSSGAICDYSVTRTGGKIEHGVCVSNLPSPEIKTAKVFRGTEDKTLAQTLPATATISMLKSKIKYYVRAYEKLSDGTVIYGNQLTFTTL